MSEKEKIYLCIFYKYINVLNIVIKAFEKTLNHDSYNLNSPLQINDFQETLKHKDLIFFNAAELQLEVVSLPNLLNHIFIEIKEFLSDATNFYALQSAGSLDASCSTLEFFLKQLKEYESTLQQLLYGDKKIENSLYKYICVLNIVINAFDEAIKNKNFDSAIGSSLQLIAVRFEKEVSDNTLFPNIIENLNNSTSSYALYASNNEYDFDTLNSFKEKLEENRVFLEIESETEVVVESDTNSLLSNVVLTNCTGFNFISEQQNYSNIILTAPNISLNFTATTQSVNSTMKYTFNNSTVSATAISGTSYILTPTNFLPITNSLTIFVTPQSGPVRTYLFIISRVYTDPKHEVV